MGEQSTKERRYLHGTQKDPAVKATYDLVMSAPTVDAQNQLALLLLTYYRGIDTGRKMEQAKAEGKQTA